MVDSTQTGFLPQRWIGDNILAHLETIDFYQHSQQPGVLLFLDFEKAFDRLDRPWMEQSMHGSSGVRSRSTAMGQPPACGHHSQGSLQRLAHSTLPSPVGGLPGQPPVAPAVRSGGPAHGRARTPVSRAAGTACPQHALGSASALHALPRRRHHHPCSLTGRRSSHTGGQHQPPLSGDWSQDADSQVHRHGHRLPTAPYRPRCRHRHHIQCSRVSHHTPGHPTQHRPGRCGPRTLHSHPAAPG